MTDTRKFKIATISFVGYGAASFGVSSEGATVTPSATSSFDTASGSNQLDEVVFTIDNHTAGKPINIATNDTDCRFYVVFGYQELADTKAPVLVSQISTTMMYCRIKR